VSALFADLEVIKAAARAAGEVVMAWYGRPLDVTYKAPGQPLTEADLAADRLLRDRLSAARPEYGWLSEESAASPDRMRSSRVWIVDPIDGTRSFIAGRPEFSLSIGLVEDGRAVAGVVYNPATDELFSSVRGSGALLETGRSAAVRLEVARGSLSSLPTTLLASRTEIQAGEFAGFDEQWQVEPVGSTAYKLARIAAGRGDVFLSRGPKSEWDICAGVLLVQEAGGLATDVRGAELRFNQAAPYVHGILASNEVLHAAVLQRLATLRPSGRLGQVEDG
jgi:myo-inositol-1(or 4)-monophosphatase